STRGPGFKGGSVRVRSVRHLQGDPDRCVGDGPASADSPRPIGRSLHSAESHIWSVKSGARGTFLIRQNVSRGADVDQLWISASSGLLERLSQLLGDSSSLQQMSQALWHACSGGQRRAAEYLLSRGADGNSVPDYAKDTPLDAATGEGTQRENLTGCLRA